MAESKELETLVYCLGPIGGRANPVITQGSAFSSKYDYTEKGYARYIEEANNVIKFQHRIINYFMEMVNSEFEEDPLAFIDAENEEDLLASIHKMKKQWKDMFKEHRKELREVLKNPRPSQAVEESSEESSSSSSAKIRRLDAEATSEPSAKISTLNPETISEAGAKISTLDPEAISEASEKVAKLKSDAIPEAGAVGVPVESFEFPISIFQRNIKEFSRILRTEYLELKKRMGKALERISRKDVVQDIKGFTFLKMSKFAKWKYALKTLSHLVPELESKMGELDLDFNKKKENEKRLTDWMYFDDGRRDRKYHHRLLITMELTGPVEEVSALVFKQMKRWTSLKESLQKNLPAEFEAFKEKAEGFKYEILYGRPMKRPIKPQRSTDSGDTLFNVEDMPEET